MAITIPGRQPVGLEAEVPQVADPREVAHYHTDLSDPNAVGKDLLSRGRESGLLAGYDGTRVNTAHAGQAALADISSVPRAPSKSSISKGSIGMILSFLKTQATAYKGLRKKPRSGIKEHTGSNGQGTLLGKTSLPLELR